jgi:hypothetical protein
MEIIGQCEVSELLQTLKMQHEQQLVEIFKVVVFSALPSSCGCEENLLRKLKVIRDANRGKVRGRDRQ